MEFNFKGDVNGRIMIPTPVGEVDIFPLFNSVKNIVSIKDFGAVGDGVTDDTDSINKAIESVNKNGGGDLLIPPGTYMIDGSDSGKCGVKMKSNVKVIFSKGAIFKQITTDRENYNIILIQDCDNVEIVSPVIVGDKSTHIGTAGEWGHGITIMNSDHVTITDPKITDCWGDGIYIGIQYFGVNVKRTDNIKIIRPYIDGVRRNGISVCSGGIIEIIDPVIKNVDGTNPKAGIDIEPESQDNNTYLENLKIINPLTVNCGIGISGIFGKIFNHKMDILIENHTDEGSATGFAIFPSNETAVGKFVVNNPTYKNNGNMSISINRYALTLPTIEMNNVSIIDCNVNNSTYEPYGSAIVMFTDGVIPYDFGNVKIKGLSVKDTRSTKQILYPMYALHLNNGGTNRLKNVSVEDIKEIQTTKPYFYFGALNGYINDDGENFYVEDVYAGGIEIGIYNYFPKRRTTNSVDYVSYNLLDLSTTKLPVIFEQTGNHSIRIFPPTGKAILPLCPSGKYLKSAGKGCKIKIFNLPDGNWMIENIVGTWTAI